MAIALWIVVAGIALASIAGFASRRSWLFDMLGHLRLQYFVGSIATTVVALLGEQWPAAAVAGATLTLNAFLVLPETSVRRARTGTVSRRSGTVRILFVNVRETNHAFERLARVIVESDPDVVVLAEVDADAIAQVRLRLPEYPFFEQQTIGPRPLGIGLLSRLALERSRTVDLAESGSPLVIARLASPAGLTVIGAHPLPPYRARWYAQRNAYMRKLADIVRGEPGEVIVLGDFNVTPWAWHYGRFLADAGLRDSRSGFGMQSSWPAFLPSLLRIPIDHAFVSAGVTVVDRGVLGRTGSDHLPIVVDVARGTKPHRS